MCAKLPGLPRIGHNDKIRSEIREIHGNSISKPGRIQRSVAQGSVNRSQRGCENPLAMRIRRILLGC